MFKRNITANFMDSLKDTPVVLVNGSRQVGKSTFVRSLLGETHQYLTLDDPSVLSSIRRDPVMFLEGLTGPVIIDEVQRAPELFLPLKKRIDEQRRFGHYVLTGSANILSLPRLGDSLAGRIEIHTLWPLSRGEIQSKKEDFINLLFDKELKLSSKSSKLPLSELIEWICQGGYPESIQRANIKRRQKWFESYIKMILDKDVRDLSNIEGLMELPNLMQLIASRCGSILNTSEISRTLGIPNSTLKRYLSLLKNLYLIVTVPAWSKNATKRLVKAPKIYINDTGLLTNFIGYDDSRLMHDKPLLGHILENFVVMELQKQMTWSKRACHMYHYRTHTGQEVDIVMEASDSKVVGLEVKLANSVSPKDFSGLFRLEEETAKNFHRGIVLYLGDTIIPFDHNKHAVPLLWLFADHDFFN